MNPFLIFAIAILGINAQATTCPDGFWGSDCNFICGKCVEEGNKCGKEDGKCESNSCVQGWTEKDCMKPVCEDGLCTTEGQCIAPNVCVCPKLYSKYDAGDGKVGCYSLRTNGLKGAGISILVLIVSILACKTGYKFSQH